ncbi:MAG: phosphatase PAP2 family protein [Deltaproteobacteria bacterium]|nr:phosphatase PAP2 family protein [Deltaproteobacteria bacterium]MBW2085493.1 phosphatase PAP2 family protein [Deltaproteobacteria bacterium]
MLDSLLKIDRILFYAINQGTRNAVFDWLMPAVSWQYLWVPLSLIVLIFLVRSTWRTRWILIILILVFVTGDAFNSRVLKPLFTRPRPYSSLTQVHLHKNHWEVTPELKPKNPNPTSSFPSTHAVNAASSATVLICFYPRFWPLMAFLAALICYSRVYIGVHYPFDVLAGVLVGLFLAGSVLVVQALIRRRVQVRFFNGGK